MRNRLILISILLLSASAVCQTTTITGTIDDLTVNPVTSGKVVFTLKPSVDTTISGNARFTPGQPVTCYIQSNGTLLNASQTGACTVVTNTSLTPAGTSYRVDICPYMACSSSFNFYAINSSYNISTIVPTPTTGPAQNFADVFSNQVIAGNKNFTGLTTLGSVGASNGLFGMLNNIEFADQFTGTDCGAKINSADLTLGANQGEIWVNQNCGMAWSTAVSLGAGHVLRFVQGGAYQSSGGITLGANTLIAGMTSAMAVNTTPNVMLQEANGSNLPAFVTVNGAYAAIEDISIEGNKSNNPCPSPPCSGIVGTSAALRFEMDRVTVGNFHNNGVTLNGGAGDKFFKLMTYQNSGDGLSCIGTVSTGGDGFVSNSEFENNLGNGMQLNACPAWRIVQNDFGANSQTTTGACALNVNAIAPLISNDEIISNNQFGNDYRNDICIAGFAGGALSSTSSNITNNSFIGSQNLLAGNVYSELVLVDGGLNVVTGNVFTASTVNPSAYGISVTAPNLSLGNKIHDNVFVDTASNSGSPAFGLGRVLDGTANGITCQTASLTLSAGWGTSAAVSGNNGTIPSCIYTITSGGASFGASPTVTYTFPGSLIQAFNSNSPICQLTTVAITGAGGAVLFNPTTATGLVQTWTAQTSTGAVFTPALSETYKVVVSCSP